MANEGRIRDDSGISEERLDASLRGGQIVEYRPDLSSIRDPKAAHALRIAYDYIYQLRGAMAKSEDQEIPELAVPEANPFIPGGNGEPTPEQCELVLGTVPPMIMSFLFAGENAFAPGDGFLYTGNQIQGRIEIIEYFGIPTLTPTEIGQYDFPGGFLNMRVAVWGDTMYVTNANKIEILNVTDRTNPILLAPTAAPDLPDYILAFNQSINNLCLCRPLLASASGISDQLKLYSLDNPTSPSLQDTYPHLLDPPPGFGLATGINTSRRGVLYTLSGTRISAFNISNPTNIRKFGHISAPPNYTFRSFYQSYGYGYLYIGSTSGGVGAVNIYNVQNPFGMSQVSSISIPGTPQSCSVEGSFLFVMYQPPGPSKSNLAVYSLLSPTAPALVTTVQMPTSGLYTYGLFTRDGAYVGHDHTTGAPVMAFFAITYPPCCNCAPSLFTPSSLGL